MAAIYSHTHVQDTPSSSWVINHGLYCYPVVSVKVEEEGVLTEILPNNITFPSLTQVVVTFTSPRVGEARLS
jgi:hypothetical protein